MGNPPMLVKLYNFTALVGVPYYHYSYIFKCTYSFTWYFIFFDIIYGILTYVHSSLRIQCYSQEIYKIIIKIKLWLIITHLLLLMKFFYNYAVKVIYQAKINRKQKLITKKKISIHTWRNKQNRDNKSKYGMSHWGKTQGKN